MGGSAFDGADVARRAVRAGHAALVGGFTGITPTARHRGVACVNPRAARHKRVGERGAAIILQRTHSGILPGQVASRVARDEAAAALDQVIPQRIQRARTVRRLPISACIPAEDRIPQVDGSAGVTNAANTTGSRVADNTGVTHGYRAGVINAAAREAID